MSGHPVRAYRRRDLAVEAMRWDGTAPSLDAIQAWMSSILKRRGVAAHVHATHITRTNAMTGKPEAPMVVLSSIIGPVTLEVGTWVLAEPTGFAAFTQVQFGIEYHADQPRRSGAYNGHDLPEEMG